MKSLINYLCLLCCALLLVNCSTNQKETVTETEAAVTDSAGSINDSVATAITTRKFIRTADLKFKVKDVAKATYAIENTTIRLGGFVTNSELTSTVDNNTTTVISADSSLETTYFTVRNEMVLRVPNARLDSTLKTIANLVEYLDYRRIKSDDVGLQLRTNEARTNRITRHTTRLTQAIDNRGKKLTETTTAEETLLDKKAQADEATLANLSLEDQVAYSTVSLSIYQRQSVAHALLPNYKNIKAYEPGFGKKMLEAIVSGWGILEAFLLFLTRLWGLFVFILIGYFLYRKYSPKFKT